MFCGETIIPKGLRGSQLSFKFTIREYEKGDILNGKNYCKFYKKIGTIKPMHAVGQPPFRGIDFSICDYLKDAHIPYSRLHNVGEPYGGGRYVDISNLFREFSADPNDPESYDFAFTDLLITALVETVKIHCFGQFCFNTIFLYSKDAQSPEYFHLDNSKLVTSMHR